jgi:hypothetical protein
MKFHSLPVWNYTGIAECSIWILYQNPCEIYSYGSIDPGRTDRKSKLLEMEILPSFLEIKFTVF